MAKRPTKDNPAQPPAAVVSQPSSRSLNNDNKASKAEAPTRGGFLATLRKLFTKPRKPEDDLILDGVKLGAVAVYYKVNQKISAGGFGTVFEGESILTQKKVAIKFENRCTKYEPSLGWEFDCYQRMKGKEGFPDTHFYLWQGPHYILGIDLLGPSLVDMRDLCGKKFSVKTTCMIGKKMDFGLSKPYMYQDTGEHIPMLEQQGLVGTIRYTSVNGHLKRELSRRDDLESLAYVMIYFLKGCLPWDVVKNHESKRGMRRIGRMKRKMGVLELCNGLPEGFASFLAYVRGLQFDQTPDYDYLRRSLNRVLEEIGQKNDQIYDWMVEMDKKGKHEKEFVECSEGKGEALGDGLHNVESHNQDGSSSSSLHAPKLLSNSTIAVSSSKDLVKNIIQPEEITIRESVSAMPGDLSEIAEAKKDSDMQLCESDPQAASSADTTRQRHPHDKRQNAVKPNPTSDGPTTAHPEAKVSETPLTNEKKQIRNWRRWLRKKMFW
ncbi:casein kinase I [Quaeritorhiza haematococci]|nr:casein kinase I [Quaeritorhiza haematococci]